MTPITDFTAPTSGGGTFTLSEHRGQYVVLYFYPRDDTPGCTTEGQDFTTHHGAFQEANAVVVGASRDTVKSHDKFCAKFGFPFPLLADPEEQLCGLFNVMKQKNMYGKQVRGIERSTFVFGKLGELLREWRGVKVPGHVEEVLAFIRGLE